VEGDKYLLLEDPITGDILMPLIYMKAILEANYSRKLASLKHRAVNLPPENSLAQHQGLLYWQWAFESSHAIKLLIRREIGESTPQGHLRLVLLPIVYNALAGKPNFHVHPLFLALHRAIMNSNYWPLVHHLEPAALNHINEISGARMGDKLFEGPRVLETTAMKYMFMFKSQREVDANKRTRTTATPVQDITSPPMDPLAGNSQGTSQQGDETSGLDDANNDLIDRLVSQRPVAVPAAKPELEEVSVPLSTDQLKYILDNRFNEIMKEMTTLKTSILSIMCYIIGATSQEMESGCVPQFNPPKGDRHTIDSSGEQKKAHRGHSTRYSPYPVSSNSPLHPNLPINLYDRGQGPGMPSGRLPYLEYQKWEV